MNKIQKNELTSSNSMMHYILSLLNAFQDEELKDFCHLFIKEYGEKLEYIPAGLGHHTYKLGLLYHTYNMLRQGEAISSIYPLNRDLLLTGILFHDCGKLVTTSYDDNKSSLMLNKEYVLLQHSIQGILIIENLALKSNLSKEKTLLIQHMIASHHGRPEWGSHNYPAFPEAEVLHHIDSMDSRLDIMFEQLKLLTDDNIITDRIPTLNNRFLYKNDL